MSDFQLILAQICNSMLEYKFTRLLYRILYRVGLIKLANYLFSLWFYINPTQKMKNEKRFFLKHTQELKLVYDSLEDDRSKSVFENILKYRATSDWACLKKSRANDNLRNQYFVPEIQFSDHEIIVDCGAFTGDTVKLFYKNIPGCRVIALEPDEKNFELLQKIKLEGLMPIKCGAWSEDTTLNFSDNGGGTADGKIAVSGNAKIEVKALDHLLECQAATYIKMDIEGAELEAIKGAKRIIGERRPKLAICLYHRPQDFFEIPLYIKKLNPNYKLYVHHHYNDTVLYAV